MRKKTGATTANSVAAAPRLANFLTREWQRALRCIMLDGKRDSRAGEGSCVTRVVDCDDLNMAVTRIDFSMAVAAAGTGDSALAPNRDVGPLLFNQHYW
jgi:hypothetical protein